MAHQPVVGAVIGQAAAAPGALRGLPAVDTHQGPAVAPTVQQKNGLLSGGAGIVDGLPQGIAETVAIAQLQLLAHIHHFNLRQAPAVIPPGQPVEGIIPLFCPVHTLHTGGGRAQQHQGLFFHAPPHGHLFGAIAGGIFGLIGMLLLLVQDQKAQLGAGGEYGGPGAHHNGGLPVFHPLPLVKAFAVWQAGMEHRNLVPKPGGHQAQQLGGQGNFRHQQHRCLSLGQHLLNEADIHRGFAGAGNAVKQRHTGFFPVQLAFQPFKGPGLLPVQHQGLFHGGGFDFPAPQNLALPEFQIAQLFQPVHRLDPGARIVADVLDAGTANACHQLQHLFLGQGAFGSGGGEGQGFLGGNRQNRDAFAFLPALFQVFLFRPDPFLSGQVGKELPADLFIGELPGQGG